MTSKPIFPEHMRAHGAGGPQPQRVPWSPDQLEALRRGAAEGLSAGKIAKSIGGACTKSAVLGKARRLGMRLPGSPGPTGPRVRKEEFETEPDPPSSPSAALAVPEAAQEAVRALVVTHPAFLACREPKPPASCQWPIGDPQERGFHFCGADAVPGKSYCAEHRAIANTPTRPYDPEANRRPRGPFRASQVGQWS